MIDSEAAKLVELKVTQLNSVQTIGIIWWVVSCALSVVIIGGVWKNGAEFAKSPIFSAFCQAITVFFLAIVAFGSFMVGHSIWLANQFSKIPSPIAPAFCWDCTATSISYGIATAIFVIAGKAWFALGKSLRWNGQTHSSFERRERSAKKSPVSHRRAE
jgi:ABC-type polysaccharide/polyol phosphate export permease